MNRDALLPCPFCGGEAQIINIGEGENAGGSCVECAACHASSNVEFEFKENFVSNWNTRALPVGGGVEEANEFLVARVSQDGREVGIDHPTEADWHDVRRAHVSLRDRLNERLGEQDLCPFKPAARSADGQASSSKPREES